MTKKVTHNGADYEIKSHHQSGKHVVHVIRDGRVVQEYTVRDEVVTDAAGAGIDPVAEQIAIAESDVRRGLWDEIADADVDPDPDKRQP